MKTTIMHEDEEISVQLLLEKRVKEIFYEMYSNKIEEYGMPNYRDFNFNSFLIDLIKKEYSLLPEDEHRDYKVKDSVYCLKLLSNCTMSLKEIMKECGVYYGDVNYLNLFQIVEHALELELEYNTRDYFGFLED